MPDPRQQLITFPLDLGMDVNSDPESVSPIGERPRVVASYNTRLTKKRGMVSKAPGSSIILSNVDRCGGIVPSGVYDSSVAFFHPGDGGSRRIAGGVAGLLSSTSASNAPQNSFYPLAVDRAGALPPGAICYQTPAACYDAATGHSYYASLVDVTGGSSAIVVTVIADNGQVVASPTRVETFPSVAPTGGRFIALSGYDAGIVRIWYQAHGTNQIIARALSVSGLSLIVGSPTVIYTPSSAAYSSIAIAYDPSDFSNLYMACFTAAGTNTHLMRINPTAMTVSAFLDVATGASSSAVHGIAYVHDGTSGKLVWMVSWPGGNCSLFESNPLTLATIWTQTNRMWVGSEVSCGFYRTASPALFHAVFAASRVGTVASTATPAGTKLEFRAIGTGGLLTAADIDIPWYRLVGQIVTQKAESTTGYYPLLPLQAVYDGSSDRYNPTSVQFLSDPSIEVMRPHYDSSGIYWNPVARVGSDSCIRYPSYSVQVASANSFVPAGDKVKLVYLSENLTEGISALGYMPRYVDMSFGGSQRECRLAGGQAIIPGALPAVWDGSEITEFQPLRAPKLFGSNTGGLGTALSGTYLFAVVVSWKDSAGHLHRSPPSNIVTLTPAGTAVSLSVTRPVTYRNGRTQEKITYTIYASQNGGTTLYAQSAIETLPATSNFWAHFNVIGTPVQTSLTPALYSDGSPQQMKLPYHPNACRDAKVIGDRVWLLDAELSGRAFFSHPLNTGALNGVFPNFNSSQYVDFPAAAGKLIALENWHEQPRFHTTSGVWTIAGEGPDAIGGPPSFAAPQQLSDYPCSDPQSLVLMPQGVIFRSGNRFALAGDSFGAFDDMTASYDIVGSAVFRDQHEVAIFSNLGGCFVYNYLKQAWTIWSDSVLNSLGEITCAIQDPWSTSVYYYAKDARRIMKLDPNTVSTTAQIVIITGWVILGGPQDDTSVQDILIRAQRAGGFGLSVSIGSNYQALSPALSFSSADVSNGTTNGRVDFRPQPAAAAARAIQLAISETSAAGEAFQPQHVTLEVIRNPGKMTRSLFNPVRK